MINDHEENAAVFKALCDPKRLMILEMLRSGEKCTCRILEKMDIGQSSLSYHMKILVGSGMVAERPEGKWVHYSISENGAQEAVELLKRITEIE